MRRKGSGGYTKFELRLIEGQTGILEVGTVSLSERYERSENFN